MARHYVGGYAGYDITLLWELNAYLVLNMDDRSRFASPSLTWSITSDLDFTVGLQFFAGSAASEYGHLPNVYCPAATVLLIAKRSMTGRSS